MIYYAGQNKKNGFTIIEVIVSIAIISILLIAGIHMLSSSMTTIASKGEDTEVLYQAQEAIEKLISGELTDYSLPSYSGIYASVSSTSIQTQDSDGNTIAVSGNLYTIYEDGTPPKEILKSFVPSTP